MKTRRSDLAPIMVAILVVLAARPATGQPTPRDIGIDRAAATDALGRLLPGPAEAGPPRPGKAVAIFYFLWLDARVARTNGGPFDLAELMRAAPANPRYGPPGAFHFWGEPAFGYYLDDDAYVIRKHAQMLADAGVDAIAFDVTNGPTYEENFFALARVFEAIRKEGGRTPQFFFLTNAGSAEVAQRLYDRIYSKGLFADLWFRWKGKPLLLAPTAGLGTEVRGFFNLRQSWAWTDPGGWFGDGRDKWPWLDHTPQKFGWHDAPDKAEAISVAVAEHPVSNIGRSFHDGKQPPPDRLETDRGAYFAEQWRRALQVDPELVFVTGWNEWIAQRFVAAHDGDVGFVGHPVKAGETFFVDQYTREYSRDIEPMRGGHGDNYYYQLVANIRRFKGVRPPLKPSPPKSIPIGREFSAWSDVGPDYADDLGDVAHRDHPSWSADGKPAYVNTSGRNDLDLARVARDDSTVFFYARTAAPLSPPSGPGWMRLLLDVDSNHATGREGYDFSARPSADATAATLLRATPAGTWERVAEIPCRSLGREIQLSIPRSSLGQSTSKGPLRLGFKWADNVPDDFTAADFIDRGDVAPNGRFDARYEE